MEKTDAAIAKIIEAINAAAMQHGAAGVELALTAVATKAQLTLAGGALCFVVAWWFYRRTLPWLNAFKWNHDKTYLQRDDEHEIGTGFMCGGFAIASGIAVAIGCVTLFSPVTWTSAFNPQLGLAMRILDKVL